MTSYTADKLLRSLRYDVKQRSTQPLTPLETSQEHGMINDYDSHVVDQADQLVYMSACVALACYILSTSPVMSHLNPSIDSSHSVI